MTLRYSDVTPKPLYLNRRRFLATGSAALASLALPGLSSGAKLSGFAKSPFSTGEKPTPL